MLAYIVVVLLCHVCIFVGAQYELHIDTTRIIGRTEPEYLSFCLDPYLKHDLKKPWGTLDFKNTKLKTLVAALAPAILRFGGTDADWSVFYDVISEDQQKMIWNITSQVTDPNSGAFVVPIFPQDIDNLISLAELAQGKLLFDLNIQKRLGVQWDATNALQLMNYVAHTERTHRVFYELGNEPNYPQFNFTGKRIAKDFKILRKVLDHVTSFNHRHGEVSDVVKRINLQRHDVQKHDVEVKKGNISLVGPDIGMADVPWLVTILRDFTKYAAKTVSAVTLHHYYFRGPDAKVSQYYDLNYFDAYETLLLKWRNVIYESAGFKIPIWIGETSDSFSKGTPNVTNRYISGLLWLDKLGISAKLGVKLVARQDLFGGNYPLLDNALNPNPDYWLSYMFKKLVGLNVLSVSVESESNRLRAYAHCSCEGNNVTNITVFMLNLQPNETANVIFDTQYSKYMDVYYMTPGLGGVLSPEVIINGRVMRLVDDRSLPRVKPVVLESKSNLHVKPLTYAFVVFHTNKELGCALMQD